MNILEKSFYSGISGAGAMTVQVSTLMWMRTIMNHQYRYGNTIKHTVTQLYKEGGIPRFYRGIGFALIQGPTSRFADTFSNTFAMKLLEDSKLPIAIKTGFASVTAGLFRIFLMPIDTWKTFLQVEGQKSLLLDKVRKNGIGVLYNGSLATCLATITGHYPWFATYNYLDSYLPNEHKILRSAFIGFSASVVSDSVSNSLRVIKTTKQTHTENITYLETINKIIETDGVKGLLGRGLKIRIITNGVQGMLFSVLWKYFQETSTQRDLPDKKLISQQENPKL